MVETMKKLPYEAKAVKKDATLEEMQEYAIFGDKGIPIKTPDNSKIFIISIDNNGNLITTEKV